MVMWLIFMCLSFICTEASKYHQSDYSVKLEIVDVPNYNKSYIRDLVVGLVYHNRTFRAVNATGYLLKDLSMNLTGTVQFYKFLSNEYRFFPITMTVDGCKEMEIDNYGVKASLQKSIDFVLHCPVKKGAHKMTYGMVNFSTFPPYIPHGRYKAEFKLFDKSNYVGELNIYATVETN